jgi:hypothetical protein
VAEIFDFPGVDERAWRARSAPIADELRRSGLSADAVEWILSEWRRRITELPTGAKTPADLMTALFGAVLIAVIDLYNAKSAGSTAPAPKMDAQILRLIRGGADDDGPGAA